MSGKTVGIIGGSGLYEIDDLRHIRRRKITTPFGKPSDEFVIGELGGAELIFLPRHGRGHRLSPSEINYRANIYGLKKLGASYVLSVSAVGSMKEEVLPGDIVIIDQFIDRTKGIRKHTFFEKGIVGHVSFGDPVCAVFSDIAYRAAGKIKERVYQGGTYLCIEGPQFSTRAESQLYRTWGATVIGMTNLPEAKLAREAGLCYATIAFSTDYDCWRVGEAEVSAEQVLSVIQRNVKTAKRIIREIPPLMPDRRHCGCQQAARHAIVTEKSRIPAKVRKDLALLIGSFL